MKRSWRKIDYKDVINIVNAHYGWSMEKHVPECKEEIRMKMKVMKRFVEELAIKAEAYDKLIELEDEWADECLDYIKQYSGSEWDKENSDDLQTIDNEWHYWRSSLRDMVHINLKELEKKEG